MLLPELQRRPFVRPLLCWILGIALSATAYSVVGLTGVLIALFLLVAVFLGRYYGLSLHYHPRWIKGAVLLALFFCLSLGITRLSAHYTFSTEQMMAKPQAIQAELVEAIDGLRLTDTEKSVLATLVLGYRKAMPRETREQFSLAGVSHILSVSGFHVAVVAGALVFLFSFLSRHNRLLRWIRYLLLMALVWGFVFLSGLSAPATRAGIMFTFFQTGVLLERSADRYNILAASAFCMLAFRPAYLFDVGFQLSYSAVFFILYFQPRMAACIPVRNPVLRKPWAWITLTLAAQMGTAFLCLFYFGRFALFFLYANLPVVVFANLLIPLGLLWLLLPAGMPGYGVLQEVLEWSTRTLVWVVDQIASLPGAAFAYAFDAYSMVAGYVILFLCVYYLRCRSPRVLLLAATLSFLWLLLGLFDRLR